MKEKCFKVSPFDLRKLLDDIVNIASSTSLEDDQTDDLSDMISEESPPKKFYLNIPHALLNNRDIPTLSHNFHNYFVNFLKLIQKYGFTNYHIRLLKEMIEYDENNKEKLLNEKDYIEIYDQTNHLVAIIIYQPFRLYRGQDSLIELTEFYKDLTEKWTFKFNKDNKEDTISFSTLTLDRHFEKGLIVPQILYASTLTAIGSLSKAKL